MYLCKSQHDPLLRRITHLYAKQYEHYALLTIETERYSIVIKKTLERYEQIARNYPLELRQLIINNNNILDVEQVCDYFTASIYAIENIQLATAFHYFDNHVQFNIDFEPTIRIVREADYSPFPITNTHAETLYCETRRDRYLILFENERIRQQLLDTLHALQQIRYTMATIDYAVAIEHATSYALHITHSDGRFYVKLFTPTAQYSTHVHVLKM